jgi:hypothetical protein
VLRQVATHVANLIVEIGQFSEREVLSCEGSAELLDDLRPPVAPSQPVVVLRREVRILKPSGDPQNLKRLLIQGVLADAWGWNVDSSQARAILDRELALLWGLTWRPKNSRKGA